MKKMKIVLPGIVLLVIFSNVTAFSQERVDDWYGKEMTELHAQLKYSEKHHGEKFKYKNYGDGKYSLTMTDYRGIKCEYVSLDFGYTVKYRIDHYSKKEYQDRVAMIKSHWVRDSHYYILKGTVVAMLDKKNHRIGFALLRDLTDIDVMFSSQDQIRVIDKY